MDQKVGWIFEAVLAASPIFVRAFFRPVGIKFDLVGTLGSFEVFRFSFIIVVVTRIAVLGKKGFDFSRRRDGGTTIALLVGLALSLGVMINRAINDDSTVWAIGGVIFAVAATGACSFIRRNFLWLDVPVAQRSKHVSALKKRQK
ncbi:MAG TPA: hypothetical protein VLK33_12125 [Terriglobales bacterium]|nr:hypothetical protein [Terriglobales bacterium]